MTALTNSIAKLLLLLAALAAATAIFAHPAPASAQTPPGTDAPEQPVIAPTATPAQQSAAPQQPAAPQPTPPGPTPSSIRSAFRVGPTTSLRPVNDVISYNQDGLVEVLFRNPALNDTAMEVELSISVPAGFHLYGEGVATDVAAGTASASYVVAPGHSRTVFLTVKADKVGRSTLHFSGHFWPHGNKDLFNPISLTHPFTVTHASDDPLEPPGDAPQPADSAPSRPAASCALGSLATGDMALLSLGLLGMTGIVLVRRRQP